MVAGRGAAQEEGGSATAETGGGGGDGPQLSQCHLHVTIRTHQPGTQMMPVTPAMR